MTDPFDPCGPPCEPKLESKYCLGGSNCRFPANMGNDFSKSVNFLRLLTFILKFILNMNAGEIGDENLL